MVMVAKAYDIVDKVKSDRFGPADITDFRLREAGSIATEEIVDNPRISLYSLDFNNGRAVFLETGADAALEQAPFFYVAQYDHAVRVFTVPFEVMIQQAQSIKLDDKQLVFIFSTGRAGSTLASKVFAQVDQISSVSEPDALTVLVAARQLQPGNEAGLMRLLDASIRLLSKNKAGTTLVIKGRSFVIELGDWLHELYPDARNIFLYRDTKSYVESGLRAFTDGVDRPVEEEIATANAYREFLSPVAPLLAEADPDRVILGAGILTLLWLSVMERAVKLQKAGIDMLAICYENWVTIPQETAVAMLNHSGCHPRDLRQVFDILERDSQEGTALSQEATKTRERSLRPSEIEEMEVHLGEHPFINSIHYEVGNTLDLSVVNDAAFN